MNNIAWGTDKDGRWFADICGKRHYFRNIDEAVAVAFCTGLRLQDALDRLEATLPREQFASSAGMVLCKYCGHPIGGQGLRLHEKRCAKKRRKKEEQA